MSPSSPVSSQFPAPFDGSRAAMELENACNQAHLAWVMNLPVPETAAFVLRDVGLNPFRNESLDAVRDRAPWMSPAGRRALVEWLLDTQPKPSVAKVVAVARILFVDHAAPAAVACQVLEHAAGRGHTELVALLRPLVPDAALIQSFELTARLLHADEPFSASTFTFIDALAHEVPLDVLRRSIPEHYLSDLPRVRARRDAAFLTGTLPSTSTLPGAVPACRL